MKGVSQDLLEENRNCVLFMKTPHFELPTGEFYAISCEFLDNDGKKYLTHLMEIGAMPWDGSFLEIPDPHYFEWINKNEFYLHVKHLFDFRYRFVRLKFAS